MSFDYAKEEVIYHRAIGFVCLELLLSYLDLDFTSIVANKVDEK